MVPRNWLLLVSPVAASALLLSPNSGGRQRCPGGPPGRVSERVGRLHITVHGPDGVGGIQR